MKLVTFSISYCYRTHKTYSTDSRFKKHSLLYSCLECLYSHCFTNNSSDVLHQTTQTNVQFIIIITPLFMTIIKARRNHGRCNQKLFHSPIVLLNRDSYISHQPSSEPTFRHLMRMPFILQYINRTNIVFDRHLNRKPHGMTRLKILCTTNQHILSIKNIFVYLWR